MTGPRVFLTGATGFIGSHLARILVREGCEIHALVRPGGRRDKILDIESKIRFLEGNLTSPESWVDAVDRIRPEICVHLAWQTTAGVYISSPENLNLAGATLLLARRLSEIGCKKMVSVGTCFEYDTSQGVLSEDSLTRPHTLYGATKLAVHQILEQYARHATMRMVWPRLFYIYGPCEFERRLVPTLIRAHLAGTTAELTSGEKVRDYLHVEDVASAIWSAAQSDLTGPVNVGSGDAVTIRDIAGKISSISGRANLASFVAMPDDPSDPRKVVADNRRLLSTGWKPAYTLEDGLRQTFEWWKRK